MNLREAWKFSKTPYVELVYKSSQLVSGPGNADQEDARRRIESTLRSAKLNKVMFSLFGCLGAAIPFAVAPSPLSLVSAIALSLFVGFAYLVLYTLQVLPSFSNADSYSLLLTLPLTERDYSLMTTLSFLRTFDYLAVGCTVVPFAAVLVLTGSVAGSLLMLGASVANVVLAVFTGLWLSRTFYRNVTRGGRSRWASVSRTVFIIAWGFAVLSVGFAFQLVTNFLPFLHQVLAGSLSQSFGIVLLVLYPFAFGLTVSSLAYPGFFAPGGLGAAGSALLTPISYVATIAFAVLALFAVRAGAKTMSSITHGEGAATLRETAKDFTLKLHNPLSAYLLKDMRMASKNPSTAFVFAFPMFGALVFFVAISKGGTISVLDVLLLTLIASSFALMAGLLLLNTEGRVLNYVPTLPLSGRTVIESKASIATLTFLPVPFFLLAVRLLGSGAISPASLVPFVEILAVAAATTAEIALFVGGRNAWEAGIRGQTPPQRMVSRSPQVSGVSMVSGSNLGRATEALVVALALVLAPLASYLVTFLFGYAESVSIFTMALVAILEGVIALAVLRLKG